MSEIDLRTWATKPHANVGFTDVALIGVLRVLAYAVALVAAIAACTWHYFLVRRMSPRPRLGEIARYLAMAGIAGASVLLWLPVRGPDAKSMRPAADDLLVADATTPQTQLKDLDTRELIETQDPREVHIIFLEQARSRLTLQGAATFEPSRIHMEPAPSFLGIYGEAPREDGKWTRVSQQFWASPNRVLLTEWDFASAGRTAELRPEFRNITVRGIPAFRRCRVSPHGQAVCQVTWVTAERYYELRVEGALRGGLSETARQLAEAVQP